MLRRTLMRVAASLAIASLLGTTAAAQMTTSCARGRTAGKWDLPSPGQMGSVDGVLEYNSRPRFALHGVLTRDGTGTPTSAARREGELHGRLVLRTPTGPVPFARA